MTVHLEIERKYDAEPGFVVPDLTDLPGCAAMSEPETHRLVASYFDTDDLRLAAHGVTLRRRRGGEDQGWHLKLPVEPGARQELRASLGRSAQTVPPRLARLVLAYTRGRDLRPVAKLETRRTVVRLLGESGDVLAEVADDTVSGQVLGEAIGEAPDEVGGKDGGKDVDGPAAMAWREIEIELVGGPPELLKAAGKRMRRAGARPTGAQSKVGRLLDGRGPGRPRSRRTYKTAGEVAVSYLAAQAETLLKYDPHVRLAEYDAVHKMRVAVRRIRSILRTYRSMLDRDRTAPLDDELRWLADELGQVRDLEVLRERFTERLATLRTDATLRREETPRTEETPRDEEGAPAMPGWLDDMAARERAAHRRLAETLEGKRYFAVLAALEDLVTDPPLTEEAGRPADEAVPPVVARAWRRVDRALTEAEELPTPEEREAARHRARRAAKRARYTAEAATVALGRPAKDVAVQAERLQEVLGRYQDGVIAQQHLAEIAAARSAGEDAFTLGMLLGFERCATDQALREVAPVWKKASRPKYLRRLGREAPSPVSPLSVNPSPVNPSPVILQRRSKVSARSRPRVG